MHPNPLSAHLATVQARIDKRLTQVLQATAPHSGRKSNEGKHKHKLSLVLLICVIIPLPYLTGCELPKTEAEAQSTPPRGQQGGGITSVEVAIARTGVLQEPTEYPPGTTRPVREVSLRAQVEGRLLNLQVDVGDRVRQGQILGRLDDAILLTELTRAESELAALQSEVARAQTQVQNARAQAEQARAELSQAKADAARRQTLVREGVISRQEAELAQTAARTAEQTLKAATAQIGTEQQAVAAAQRRVEAQRAAVAQAKERQSYTLLASSINGIVLDKVSEPGNLIQPGGEVLKLGDFSQVKVEVPVSELKLSNIRVGQSVQVKLDAFPNESFSGQVRRISPVADRARQLQVEITIPNSNGQIGSGLLARVSFEESKAPRVVVPVSALQEGNQESGVVGTNGRSPVQGSGVVGAGLDNNSPEKQTTLQQNPPSSNPKAKIVRLSAHAEVQNPKSTEATVFVVTGEGAEAKVQARRVQVGDRANGQVEIVSGLRPEERFVARSGKPLKDGESVRLSAVSEK